MKSKIIVIAGVVVALAITATAPVRANTCDCDGRSQGLSTDKPVPLPPQKPANSGLVAGGFR
jgi:hypothetical protein